MSSSLTPDPLHPGSTVGGDSGQDYGWDDPQEIPTRAVFSGDAPYPSAGVPGTVVSGPWPANPSVVVELPGAGRGAQMPGAVSGDLQLGPSPNRIPRWLPSRMSGENSANFGQNAPGPGFPYNGEWQHIDHLWTARTALGTKGPQKLADDNAVIPAVFAGNPKS
jgi:hypothetical protein